MIDSIGAPKSTSSPSSTITTQSGRGRSHQSTAGSRSFQSGDFHTEHLVTPQDEIANLDNGDALPFPLVWSADDQNYLKPEGPNGPYQHEVDEMCKNVNNLAANILNSSLGLLKAYDKPKNSSSDFNTQHKQLLDSIILNLLVWEPTRREIDENGWNLNDIGNSKTTDRGALGKIFLDLVVFFALNRATDPPQEPPKWTRLVSSSAPSESELARVRFLRASKIGTGNFWACYQNVGEIQEEQERRKAEDEALLRGTRT